MVPPWEKVILLPSERVTTVPYLLSSPSSPGVFFLFPISRFPTAAIVAANLRLLLEEILIKEERTKLNGGEGERGREVSDRTLLRVASYTQCNTLRASPIARLALSQ